ncbi:branched-chain amino acid ABC transporter permease [Nocardioides zeae]|uniref:Branched-chain amino acid ABC transporter permease n=1 Tax=Nocardioides imazamoxiresistens TaxID=3231893 RepID=A0ABU3PQY7_9ACTN|nr:branched-chain amino acid ABC transporter permease [Nocardioides zeae]MDT9591640.1 branched-chain amino acid ABC transporter permease [Nocardioides zeae]
MPETSVADRPSAAPSPAAPTTRDVRSATRLLGTRESRILAVVVAVAAVAALASANDRILAVANFGLIAAVAAIGLNVAMGTTGIMSLGHGVFVGFGAFTAAVLADHGVPYFFAAVAAMAVAALASLTIGPLALRLSGLYLAVGTIGIAYVGEHLFVNLRSLTGGGAGRIVEAPVILGVEMSRDSALGGRLVTSDMKWFVLLVIVTLLVGVMVAAMQRLRWGRALNAIRDNESSAAAAGIAVTRARVMAFAISAALGGLSGALLAGYLRFLNPESFGLEQSIQYLAMVIIGGLGSVGGAVVGALLITALPTLLGELTSALGLVEEASGTSSTFNTGTLSLIAYGLVIVLVMVLAPHGIAGGFRKLGRRLRAGRAHKAAGVD